MMGRDDDASHLGLLLGRNTGTYWYLVPSYALCFILPLTVIIKKVYRNRGRWLKKEKGVCF